MIKNSSGCHGNVKIILENTKKDQPIAISNLPCCSSSAYRYNFPKTWLLVSWERTQYARDGEGPDLGINGV
jgi:hypothetical protein